MLLTYVNLCANRAYFVKQISLFNYLINLVNITSVELQKINSPSIIQINYTCQARALQAVYL